MARGRFSSGRTDKKGKGWLAMWGVRLLLYKEAILPRFEMVFHAPH